MPRQDFQLKGCTGNDLAAMTECWHCLSEKQLLEVWFILWVILIEEIVDESIDGFDILKDTACLTCLSDKQMLEAKVSMLADYLGAVLSDIDIVKAHIGCMECVPPKLVRAGILGMICKLFRYLETNN